MKLQESMFSVAEEEDEEEEDEEDEDNRTPSLPFRAQKVPQVSEARLTKLGSVGFSAFLGNISEKKDNPESDDAMTNSLLLQLLAGSFVPDVALPLHVFVLRVSGLSVDHLARFRNGLVVRHKGLHGAWDKLSQSGAIIPKAFQTEYAAMQKVNPADSLAKEECNEVAKRIFEACDASHDGALQFEEVLASFSAVAPLTTIEQIRMRLLLTWGSWRQAFGAIGKTDESGCIYPHQLADLAASIDINPDDAQTLWDMLDMDGSGSIDWEEFTNEMVEQGGQSITLHELAVRMWLGKDPSLSFDQVIAKLPINNDAPLLLENFASQVFGVVVIVNQSMLHNTRAANREIIGFGKTASSGGEGFGKQNSFNQFGKQRSSGSEKKAFGKQASNNANVGHGRMSVLGNIKTQRRESRISELRGNVGPRHSVLKREDSLNKKSKRGSNFMGSVGGDDMKSLQNVAAGAQAMVKKANPVPCVPQLTPEEVTRLYLEMKRKHGRVTLNHLRGVLNHNLHISDVIAINKAGFSPGETIAVRYRVPRDLEAQLLAKPFIAAVPADMKWTSGGGGTWMLRGVQVTDIPGAKGALGKQKREGALQLTVPALGQNGDLFEVRLFSSPDGLKIGKQVGTAAKFEMLAPPPTQLLVASAGQTPTSLTVLWKPPTQDFGTNPVIDYVVRGKPVEMDFEERVSTSRDFSDCKSWCHVSQSIQQFCSYRLDDLMPGLPYCIDVMPLHELSREEKSGKGESFSQISEGTASLPVLLQTPHCLPPKEPSAPWLNDEVPERLDSFELCFEPPFEVYNASVTGYQLFWDRGAMDSDENPDNIKGEADDEPAFVRDGVEFFTYPSNRFFISQEVGTDVVNAIVFVMAEEFMKVARFCCAAVNSAGVGEIGPSSDAVTLPHMPGRELQRLLDVEQPHEESMAILDRVLAVHGGVDGLVAVMAKHNLIPSEDVDLDAEIAARRRFMSLIESAGGRDNLMTALDGIDLKDIHSLCAVMKAVQAAGGSYQAWERLVSLIGQNGGIEAALAVLSGMKLQDLAQLRSILEKSGLLDEGPTKLNTLLDRFHPVGGLPKFCRAVDEVGLTMHDIVQNLNLLSHIVGPPIHSTESWQQLVIVSKQTDGPTSTKEILRYIHPHHKEFISSIVNSKQAVGCDEVISAVVELQGLGMVGSVTNRSRREGVFDILSRLGPAGCESLIKVLGPDSVQMKCLVPALGVVSAAGLFKAESMAADFGEKSDMVLWTDMAKLVGVYGGIGPSIERLKTGGEKEEAVEKEPEIDVELAKKLITLCGRAGGITKSEELLQKVTAGGGCEKILRLLGDSNIGDALEVFQIIKDSHLLSGGKQGLSDLLKLCETVKQAGGTTAFVEGCQHINMRMFGSVLSLAERLAPVQGNADIEVFKFLDDPSIELLHRFWKEIKPAKFLDAFKDVHLADLVLHYPLFYSAGFFQKDTSNPRGGITGGMLPGLTVENLAELQTGVGCAPEPPKLIERGIRKEEEAFLRWLKLVGGLDKAWVFLSRIGARLFKKCMQILSEFGLGNQESGPLCETALEFARGLRDSGGFHRFLERSSGMDVGKLIQILHDLTEVHLKDSSAWGHGQTQRQLEEIFAAAHSCGGVEKLAELLGKVDSCNLETIVGFLQDARLDKVPRHKDSWLPVNVTVGLLASPLAELDRKSIDQKAADNHFAPWYGISRLIRIHGGPREFLEKAQQLNLKHFDSCIRLLHAAGAEQKTGSGQNWQNDADEEDSEEHDAQLLQQIEQWVQVVEIFAVSGGPAYALQCLQGSNVRDFLSVVRLLREAGLVRPREDYKAKAGGASPDPLDFSAVEEFLRHVIDCGGFQVFWWALKSIDLKQLKQNLHCCEVMKNKLIEHTSESWAWQILRNPEEFDNLFSRLSDEARANDKMTHHQRMELLDLFRGVGGVTGFLRSFRGLDLKAAAENARILQDGLATDSKVVQQLALLWSQLKFDERHLRGLNGLICTPVRWTTRRDQSDPEPMWHQLHEHMTWLLRALDENEEILKTMGLDMKHVAFHTSEPDITPACFAQFLHVLRPIGGVKGFLKYFRGLDIATAATQARALHQASIHSEGTAKRLANIYRLLRYSREQLQGLELFIHRFASRVMLDETQDQQGPSERWQVLAKHLWEAVAVPKQVTKDVEGDSDIVQVGTQRIANALFLGTRISKNAGIGATETQWDQLCMEMQKASGLGSLLEKLQQSTALGNTLRPHDTMWTLREAPKPQRMSQCLACGAWFDYRLHCPPSGDPLDSESHPYLQGSGSQPILQGGFCAATRSRPPSAAMSTPKRRNSDAATHGSDRIRPQSAPQRRSPPSRPASAVSRNG